jgi:hypothetical protein
MAAGLLERVVRREPLGAGGKSGAHLERAWLDDGSTVVVKHADPAMDWIMQATGDDGRIASMWTDGTFARLPDAIDHTILEVGRAEGRTVVVMRDAAADMCAGERMDGDTHHRVLSAAAALHDAFAGAALPGLCDLGRYYAFLSPQVCARFAGDHDVPRLALLGWERFDDVVASDVAAAIAALHDDPGPLVRALSVRQRTLVHGDLKMANLGVAAQRVVVIDWGTLTCWAPASVDLAWYLAINGAAIGRDPGQLLDDISAGHPGLDDVAMRLALLGALVQLGWEKALGATSDDLATRRRERAGLSWWTDQARAALALL